MSVPIFSGQLHLSGVTVGRAIKQLCLKETLIDQNAELLNKSFFNYEVEENE